MMERSQPSAQAQQLSTEVAEKNNMNWVRDKVVDGRTIYLNRIGSQELLKEEEPYELAQTLNKGRLAEAIMTCIVNRNFSTFHFSTQKRNSEDSGILEPEITQRRVKHDAPVPRGLAEDYLKTLKLDQKITLTSIYDLEQEADEPVHDAPITTKESSKGIMQNIKLRLAKQLKRSPTDEELVEEKMRMESITTLHWIEEDVLVNQSSDALEAKLEADINDAEKARTKFIESNLRLVISITKKYGKKDVLDIDDYDQSGTLGLIRAVEKFDWRKGYKFSSYASTWIKNPILRARYSSDTIRKPENIVIAYASLLDTIALLRQNAGGRMPSLAEIAKEAKMKPKTITTLLITCHYPYSLNAFIEEGMESDNVLGKPQEDVAETVIKSSIWERDLNSELKNLFEQTGLNPREIRILQRLFGIAGEDKQELAVVGEEFGISAERVRQIKNKALEKLRKKTSQDLRVFLDS